MIAGYGAVPVVGYVIGTVKLIELPFSEAKIVRAFEANEELKPDGLSGFVPSSYFWSNELISA